VVEASHFAQPDFRVNNKIFATLPRAAGVVCLKSTPTNVDALVTSDSLAFSDEWRGRWLRVRLDQVSFDVLEDLMLDAWSLVAPKALSNALRASRR
jgi:hypothetical protein